VVIAGTLDGEYSLFANSFRPGERVDGLPIAMNMAGDTADDVDHDQHPQRADVGSWLAHTDREIIKMEQDLYQPCSTEVVEGQHAATVRPTVSLTVGLRSTRRF